MGLDPARLPTPEKMAALRRYRQDRCEKLVDAVYARRGWTPEGAPALATRQRLGIDIPVVIALVQANGG